VADDLGVLIGRMEDLLVPLRERRDHRRFFHATYLRTTRAVAAELEKADGFADRDWVARWDVAFARLYLDALAAGERGDPVPRPWAEAFTSGPDINPPRYVLLGMNAHINYDLPQALLAVISDADYGDPALLASREADHRHIDEVLAGLIDDTNSGWFRRAYKRLLSKARAGAWDSAGALAAARRQDAGAYQCGLDDLARLVTARAADIIRPGPLLPRLLVRGFGIKLTTQGESQ
jgi:Family of unknown function (DUF5995)